MDSPPDADTPTGGYLARGPGGDEGEARAAGPPPAGPSPTGPTPTDAIVLMSGQPVPDSRTTVGSEFEGLRMLEPHWVAFDKEEAITQEKHISVIQARLDTIRGSIEDVEAHLKARAQAEHVSALACGEAAKLGANHVDTDTIAKGLQAFAFAQARIGGVHQEFCTYINETLLPRVGKLRREVGGEGKALAKSMKKQSATVQKYREDSVAAFVAHVKEVESAARTGVSSIDPWLSEQRYKDALRLLRKGKTDYRKAMQALYTEYQRVDTRRMQELQEIMMDYFLTYKQQLLKLSEAVEAPKQRVLEVDPAKDLGEFRNKNFQEPKRSDPMKEVGYLTIPSKQIVIQGYLSMYHGAVFGSWKKHWFVVTCSGWIHYYQADVQVEKLRHGTPEASAPLRDTVVSSGKPHKLGEGVFEVIVNERGWLFDTQKTLTLKAGTHTEVEQWIDVVRCVSLAAQRANPNPRPTKQAAPKQQPPPPARGPSPAAAPDGARAHRRSPSDVARSNSSTPGQSASHLEHAHAHPPAAAPTGSAAGEGTRSGHTSRNTSPRRAHASDSAAAASTRRSAPSSRDASPQRPPAGMQTGSRDASPVRAHEPAPGMRPSSRDTSPARAHEAAAAATSAPVSAPAPDPAPAPPHAPAPAAASEESWVGLQPAAHPPAGGPGGADEA